MPPTPVVVVPSVAPVAAFLTVTVAPFTGPLTAEPLMVVLVTAGVVGVVGVVAAVVVPLPPLPPQAARIEATEIAARAGENVERM